jgi:hypothetical protein
MYFQEFHCADGNRTKTQIEIPDEELKRKPFRGPGQEFGLR